MEYLFLNLQYIGALLLFIMDFLPEPGILSTLALILYLILILLPPLVRQQRLSTLLHVLLTTTTLVVSPHYPGLLLLLPLQLTRALTPYTLPLLAEAAIRLLPAVFVPGELLPLFLTFTIMIFLLHKKLSEYAKKNLQGELKIDTLERENQGLLNRMARLEELEREKELYIKLEERNRIARQLHDELGHTITGSLVQLEAAKMVLEEDPQRAERMITTVMGVLNSGMNTIRLGLKGLKPASADFGIQQLKKLLGDFEKSSGIRAHLISTGNMGAVPIQLWPVITGNIKEALTNILKHSSATEVQVEITEMNRIIKAGIQDNGKGSPELRPGMGLAGIEERTREAGGTLILDGSEGFILNMIFRKQE